MFSHSRFGQVIHKVLFGFMRRVVDKKKMLYARQILRGARIKSFVQFQERNAHPIMHGEGASFVGYYDKSPYSPDNRFVFFYFSELSEKTRKEVGVAVWDREKNISVPLAITSAWSWQIGARLQWVSSGAGYKLFFNQISGGKVVAVGVDPFTGNVVDEVNDSIFEVSNEGSWALTLDFGRLYLFQRGYGYSADASYGGTSNDDNGIWLVELKVNRKKLLFTMNNIANFCQVETMLKADHWVNHIWLSDDDKYFVFVHFWVKDKKRFSRFLAVDIEEKKLVHLGQTLKAGHFCFIDSRTILAWQGFDNESGFNYIDITDGSLTPYEHTNLYANGHILRCPMHEEIVVCDTTQKHSVHDGSFSRKLRVCNIKNGNCREIISAFEPSKFRGDSRVDLHPRWDRTGDKILIDTSFNGFRRAYELDVSCEIRQLLSTDG